MLTALSVNVNMLIRYFEDFIYDWKGNKNFYPEQNCSELNQAS